MKKSEIITAIIAAYGAVLSTIAIVRQWKSDRVKVKLTVRKNMQMVGSEGTRIRPCVVAGHRVVEGGLH